jgi:hypothetical protein
MGVFYMGRDPSEQGNIFRDNFIHHTGKAGASVYGAYAVYLDDGACGTTVESNVFFKVRTAAVYVHGGHDNVLRNNILVDSKATFGSAWDNRTWSKYVSDPLQVLRLRRAVDILRPPYASRYPRLADSFETDPHYRRGNIVHQNLSVRSGSFDTGSNDDARENLVTDEDPGFVDAAAMNFQLKPHAPIFAKVSGFGRIPFERIGLYTDEYRQVLPAHQRSRLVEEDDGRQ